MSIPSIASATIMSSLPKTSTLLLTILSVASIGLAGTAKAHEFWIEPESYVVSKGAPIVAELKIGQKFKGNSYSYNPRDFERFEILLGNKVQSVTGTLGDRPALNQALPGEGLAVLVHQSDLENLNYDTFEKFESFATNQDQPDALELHKARGLPNEDFKEVYRRFGKSYVKLGNGEGADKAIGMELELIAKTNPYGAQDAVSFELLYKGQPQTDTQISVFVKPIVNDAEVAKKAPQGELVYYRTDEYGLVDIPRTAGTDTLVSAVLIAEPDAKIAAESNAVWYSLWASATFRTQ